MLYFMGVEWNCHYFFFFICRNLACFCVVCLCNHSIWWIKMNIYYLYLWRATPLRNDDVVDSGRAVWSQASFTRRQPPVVKHSTPVLGDAAGRRSGPVLPTVRRSAGLSRLWASRLVRLNVASSTRCGCVGAAAPYKTVDMCFVVFVAGWSKFVAVDLIELRSRLAIDSSKQACRAV